MERIVHISHSFEEADQYDIEQQINLSYSQRLDAARILKERVYGKDVQDVKECHRKK
jgi:hypothetical protein